MQKLSKKEKLHHERRSRDELKKRWKKPHRKSQVSGMPSTDKVHITFPKNLYLQYSPSRKLLIESINRLKETNDRATAKHIILDFTNTETITPEGMLLLYAELDFFLLTNIRHHIRIRRPNNPRCCKVFEQVGLYSLLRIKPRDRDNKRTYESVIHWRKLEGSAAGDLTKLWESFAEEICSDALPKAKLKKLFVPVSEAVSNSMEHGYLTDQDGLSFNEGLKNHMKKWWMLAQVRNDKLTVVIADLGIGIPETVTRQNMKNNDQLWFASIVDSLRIKAANERLQDSYVIKKILEASSPSGTGKDHRGHGLKDICKIAEQVTGSYVSIWSNKGQVQIRQEIMSDSSQDVKIKRNSVECQLSINGTIIHWNVPIQITS